MKTFDRVVSCIVVVIFIALFGVFTYVLLTMTAPKRTVVNNTSCIESEYDIKPFTYKGHTLLKIYRTTDYAFVHDPDCIKCKK